MTVAQARIDRSLLPLTVGAVALVSLGAFEDLAVTTAMPTAAQALHGLRLYPVAFAAPLAGGVVALVLAGLWSDRRGPLRPLWTGLGVLTAGLLLAGSARDMWMLIAGRLAQGFGNGLIAVALYVVVGRVYPSAQRPRVFAALAAAWVVPALVGPALAGVIVERVGWRWVFLSVPVLVLVCAGLMWPRLRSLDPGDPDPAAGAAGPREVAVTAGAAVTGSAALRVAVVVAGGLVLLHLGGQASGGGKALLVGAGLVVLARYLPRLLPAGTLALRRGLPAVIAVHGMVGAAFLSAEVFVPLLLSRERGLSPATAGAALTVAALAWSASSWYLGRPGPARPPVHRIRVGAGLVAAGIGCVAALLVPGVPFGVAVFGWGLSGLGMGFAYPTLSALVLDLSTDADQGSHTSALHLADRLGSAAALALGGAVFAALIDHSVPVAYGGGLALAAALACAAALAAPRVQP